MRVAGRWLITVLCAVTWLAVASTAPSQNIHKCAAYCKDNDKSNIYPTGSTYVYSYTAETDTFIGGVDGGTNDVSKLRVTATATVHVPAPCEYILELSDVSFSSRGELSANASAALTASPLSFSMHRGAVGALCPGEQDARTPWALNFKRGVLSALQTGKGDMRQSHVSHERDVAGDCFTRFHIEPTHQDLLTVRRFKDLTQCSSRKQTMFSLPSSSHGTGKSRALIQSHHNCTQTLDNHRLVSSSCHETHKLEPFSNGRGGAVTVVRQTLVLWKEIWNGQQIPKISVPIARRTTLLYQEVTTDLMKESKEQVRGILHQMEDATRDGVEERATVLFADLVAVLKRLDRDDLQYVIREAKHTKRYMILDAMQLIQTDESIATMLELLKSKILSEGEFNSWLSSLAFNNNPSLIAIRMLTPLLDQTNKNAVLSISSMIYRYCQNNQKCLKEDTISTALRSMEKYLGTECEMTSLTAQDDIILALKGLGNAGITNSKPTLINCYKKDSLPIEIRLQALSAFRRFSCDKLEAQSFFDILGNGTEASEIRIAAYLAAMQCPTYKTIYKIRGILLHENVNQVGSFIWTHLTNIQESSARWKNDVKYILSSESLRKKFDTNFRKYSRNYEFSSFIESLNAGGAVESNIIFSPESYIPRSAMVNLTLDVFGETINILEIGGRADGLEETFERMFGPDGYFPDETLSNIVTGWKNNDGTNDLETFIPTEGNKRIRIPKGTVYARIFGNELNYFNFKTLDELSGSGDIFQDMLNSLFHGEDIDFVKSFSIVDAVYSVPTIIGFPLNLALNATGTTGLKIGGKVDIKNFRDLKMDITGHVVPSAAFRVIGTMLVDAFVTKSGLKIDASMNSNSYINGNIRVDGGKMVDIKIKVPKERMDLVKISSELYLVNPSGDSRLLGHPNREAFQSCGSRTVAAITGMQLCTDVSYPNASSSMTAPSFPLTGPSRYVLDLKKIDNFDAYELKYHRESLIVSNEPVHVFNVHLDTPNSSINRKIDVGYVIYPKALNASAKFHTPFKQYDFNGKITNTAAFKTLEIDMLADSKRAIGLKGSISSQDDKTSANINMQYFDLALEVDGFVAYTNKNKYSTFISLSGFTKEKVTFLGDLNKENDKWGWTCTFTNPEMGGDMQGALTFRPSMYSIQNSLNYTINDRSAQRVTINVKYENIIAGMLKKLGITFSLQSTEYPQSNAEFSWGFQKTHGYIDHTAVAGLGEVTWKTHQLYRLKAMDGYHDFEAKCALNCLSKNIDYLASLKYLTNFKGFSAYSLAHLNDQQRVFAKIELLKDPASNNIKASLECTLPKRRWLLDGHLTHKLNEYSVLFTGAAIRNFPVEEETSFKAVGSYVDLSDNLKRDHALTLHITHTAADMKQTGPWTLKGKLLVSDKRVECSASSDYEKSRYAAVLLYIKSDIHRITLVMDLVDRHYENAMEFVIEGPYKRMILDLDLEKRIYISMDFNMTNYNQELNLLINWDMNNNPENKFNLSFANSQGQQNLRIDYPGQTIIGISSFEVNKVKIFGHWNENQWISYQALMEDNEIRKFFEITLKSTIFGSNEQAFVFLFSNIIGQSVDMHMNLKWLNDFVTLNATGNYLLLTNLTAFANLNSTYELVPNITVNFENLLSHEINSMSSTTALKLLYNEDPYMFSAKYLNGEKDCNAEYALTGPRAVISRANYQYFTNKALTKVSGIITWFDKEIFMKYDQEPQRANIVLMTPFHYIEETTFMYVYDFQSYRTLFTIEALLLKENFRLTSAVEHPSVHAISGAVRVECTFLPSTRMTFEHQTLESIQEKLNVLYGEYELNLVDLEFNTDKTSRIMFNLAIPRHTWNTSLEREIMHGTQNISVRYIWNNDDLFATVQFPNDNHFNAEKELYLIEINGTLITHKTSLEMTSTIEKKELIFVLRQGDVFEMHAVFDKDRNADIVQSELMVKMGSDKGGIVVTNNLNVKNTNHKIMLYYNNWIDEIDTSYSIAETGLTNAMIKWNRPKEKSDQTDMSFNIIFSLESENDIFEPKITISDKKYNEYMDINGKMLEGNQSRVILLTARSSKFNDVNIEISYDLKPHIISSEIMANWGDKMIKLSADAAFNDALIMSNVVLNSTEDGLSRLTFSYNETENEIKLGLFRNEDISYHAYAKYDLQPDLIKLLADAGTPNQKYIDLEIDLYAGDGSNYAKVMIARSSSKIMEFLSSASYNSESYDISISLHDTLYSMPEMSIVLKTVRDNSFDLDSQWKYNEKEATLKAQAQYWNNKFTAKADMKTDLEILPSGHMDVHYDFTSANNTVGLNFALNDQFVILNGLSFAGENNSNISMNLLVKSSIYEEKINVDLEEKRNNGDLQSIRIKMEKMDQQLDIVMNVLKDTQTVRHNFIIKTPIKNWENITGAMFVTQEDDSYSAGITGEMNGNILAMTSDVSYEGTEYCSADVKFISSTDAFGSFRTGFVYDMRNGTNSANLYLHPLSERNDSHKLEVIFQKTNKTLMLGLDAKSPAISGKLFKLLVDFNFDMSMKFIRSLFHKETSNKTMVEGQILVFKVGTLLNECDLAPILIAMEVRQFKNGTDHFLLDMKLNKIVNKGSVFYTSGPDKAKLELYVETSIDGYEKASFIGETVPGKLNASLQMNTGNAMILRYNSQAILTKTPILEILLTDTEYLTVTIGQLRSHFKLNTANNAVISEISYHRNNSQCLLTVNATTKNISWLNFNGTLERLEKGYLINYELNNTFTTKEYRNINGMFSYKSRYDMELTLFAHNRKLLYLRGFREYTKLPFVIEYQIETALKALQEHSVVIRFNPEQVDTYVKVSYQYDYVANSLEGQIAVTPNGDQGTVRFDCAHKFERYVHFDWNLKTDQIEAALDTSHPRVKDLKLTMKRQSSNTEQLYTLYAKKGNDVIDSKFKVFRFLMYGLIELQMTTPFPVLSSFDVQLAYNAMQSLEIDVEYNRKIYNFKTGIHTVENSASFVIMLNTQNPNKLILSVSGELQHEDLRKSRGELGIELFNRPFCRTKYIIKAEEQIGNFEFTSLISDFALSLKGNYDITIFDKKIAKVYLKFQDRFYEVESLVSRQEGTVTISDFVDSKLINEQKIMWYSKRIQSEQQIGIEHIINNKLSKCEITVEPNRAGTNVRLLVDVHNVQSVIKLEWKSELNKRFGLLSADLLNGQVAINSYIENNMHESYLVKFNLDLPFKKVNSLSFVNSIHYKDDYLFDALLHWQRGPVPENITMKAEISPNPRNFKAGIVIQTPLSQPTRLRLDYDIVNPTKYVRMDIKSKNDPFVAFSTSLNSTALDANLELHIENVSNFTLLLYHRDYDNGYLKYTSEDQITELSGGLMRNDHILNGTFNIKTVRGKGPDFDVVISVDEKNLKGSAVSHLNDNKNVEIEIHLKPEDLYMKLETPFANIKSIKVAGSYNIITDKYYNLRAQGYWNENRIYFDGSLKANTSDHVWMQMNANLSDSYLSLKSSSEMSDDLLDFKFHMHSSHKMFDKLKLNVHSDRSNKTAIKSSMLAILPFKDSWSAQVQLDVLFNDLDYTSRSVRFYGRCLDYTFSITSSVLIDSSTGIYDCKNNIDIPVFLTEPITLNVTFLNEEQKPMSLDLLFDYTDVYALVILLDKDNNNLVVTLTEDEMLSKLLLEISASYDETSLQFKGVYINNVINGNFTTVDGALSSNLLINMPLWDLHAKYSLKADVNPRRNKLYLDLNTEVNKFKFINYLCYWQNDTKLQVDVIIPRENQAAVKHAAIILLEGPIYVVHYSAQDKEMIIFKLHEKVNSIYFKYADIILLDANVEDDNGHGIAKYKGWVHRYKYKKTHSAYYAQIQSPLLASGLISAELHRSHEFENSLLRITLNSGNKAFVGYIYVKQARDLISLILGLSSGNIDKIRISEYEWDNLYDIPLQSPLIGTRKETKMTFIKSDVELSLLAESDFLPLKEFATGIKIDKFTSVAYIRNGAFDLNQFARVTLDSDFYKNMYANLTIETPAWRYMQKFNLNATTEWPRNFVLVKVQSSFTSNVFGNDSVKAAFNLTTNDFKVTCNVAHIFENAPERDFEFILVAPLKFSDYFVPTLSLKDITNSAEYSIFVSYINIAEMLHLGAGVRTPSARLTGTLTAKSDPVPMIELAVDTPITCFSKLRLYLHTNVHHLDGSFLTNYLILNEYKIELRYALTFKTNHISAHVHLTTPFEEYDKYSMEFVYINSDKNVLKAKLYYPSLSEAVGVEFIYLMKGFTNTHVFVHYNIPYIESYKKFSAVILSEIYQSNFIGEVSIQDDVNTFGVSSNNIFSQYGINSNTSLFMWTREINMLSKISNDDIKQLDVKMISVDEGINIDILQFSMESNAVDAMLLSLNLYSKQYVTARLTRTDTSAAFETINVWKSVSMSYTYDVTHNEVQGAVCWDLMKKNESQVAFGYAFAITSLKSYVMLPSRQLIFDYSLTSSRDRDSSDTAFAINVRGRLTWQEIVFGLEISYDHIMNIENMMYDRNASVCIEFPSRALKYVNQYHTVNPNGVGPMKWEKIGVDAFFWDASRDPLKNITVYISGDSDGTVLGMRHPALRHKLEARMLRNARTPNQLNGTEKSYARQFQLEYSADPRDLLLLDYYRIDQDRSFESGLEVRHLASHIGLGYSVNVTMTDEVTQYLLNLKYIDPSEDNAKRIRLFGKLHRTNPVAEGYIENDLNKISGTFSTWSNGITAQIVSNFNLPLLFKASRSDPSFDLNIVAGPSKSYNVHAAMPSDKEITVYLEHDLYGALSKDASFVVRLNTSRLLWSKVHWKTGIWKEIRDNILNEYDDLQYIAEDIGQSFVDAIPHDIGGRLYKDIAGIGNNVTRYMKAELVSIRQDYPYVISLFKKFFSEDSFYMNFITDQLTKIINYLKSSPLHGLLEDMLNNDYLKTIYNKLISIEFYELCTRDVTSMLQKLSERVSTLRQDLKRMKIQLKSSIIKNIQRVKTAITSLESQMSSQLDRFEEGCRAAKKNLGVFLRPYLMADVKIRYQFNEAVAKLSATVNDLTQRIENYVYSIREFRELIENTKKVWSMVKELLSDYSFDAVLDEFTKTCDTILNDARRIFEEYKLYCDAAIDAFIGDYPMIYNLTEMSNIQNETNRILQKVIWVWNYYDAPAHLRSLLRYARQNLYAIVGRSYRFIGEEVLNTVDTEATDVVRRITTPDQDRKFIFRPDLGHVELVQSLPVEWHGFDRMPEFKKLQIFFDANLDGLRRRYSSFDADTYALWLYSKLTEFGGAGREPPAVHAMLVGRGDYRTFDGRFFRLSGDCKYLLLADADDGGFGVFAEYEMVDGQPTKTALSVSVHGDTVRIAADGHVTANGEPQELPFAIGDRFTLLRDHAAVRLRYGGRYSVDWDLRTDVTVFRVKRWHRGTTLGLLGRADEERYNDYTLANGTITEDPVDFQRSWMVRTDGCSGPTVAEAPSNLAQLLSGTIAAMSRCGAVLGTPHSALAGCYSIVDYQPFYRMCLGHADPCLAAHAYRTMCEISGATEVAIPDQCLACQHDVRQSMPGEEISPIPKVDAADVVFVVEEVNALSLIDFGELTLSLQRALREEDLGASWVDGNRYSVVGWGGEFGPAPYSRTANADIWSDAWSAAALFNQISFSFSDDNENRNVMPALEYASRLDFRPGAVKILVLVQAKECQGSEKFEDITSLLNGHDLTLHILEADSIKPTAVEHKPLKVFGVDRHGAYTIKHQRGDAPDVQIANKVSLLRDQCTSAAFESQGSLFNLDRAVSPDPPGGSRALWPSRRRAPLDTRFAQVWAHRLASGAARAARGSCDCMRDVRRHRGLIVCRRNDFNQQTDWEKPLVVPDIGGDDLFEAKDVSVEYSDETFV